MGNSLDRLSLSLSFSLCLSVFESGHLDLTTHSNISLAAEFAFTSDVF